MNYKRLKLTLLLGGCSLLCGGLAARAFPASSAVPGIAPGPELDTLLRGVEEKYNHLKTLRLRFRQIYQQDRQVLREEGGTLYLRKPGQMRWEYENPEPKLFLTDGRRVMLYVPQEKRVTQASVKASDDLRSPMRFLLGGLKFQKEFQQIEKVLDVPPLDSRDTMVKAIPKQMADRLEWVMLEISPEFQIRRLIMREPGGIQTEFRFGDETTDLRLAPELFHFQPPAGTEVVEQ
jgi:outer membrane lipoprotein carrier protein